MKSDRRNELEVGAFLALALVLAMLAIWMLGSAQNLFVQRDQYFITVPDAAGISPGAKITVSGVNAGQVESFSLNRQDRTVRINLRVSNQFADSIRADSFAEVVTQGVLGDKLIAIAAGSASSPRLLSNSEIPSRKESSLQTLLGKGDQLASRVSSLVKDLNRLVLTVDQQFRNDRLAGSLEKLDRILGKIDQGNGTLGGLVNDPKLYDDVKALIGESNENRIVRNVVRNSVKSPEAKK